MIAQAAKKAAAASSAPKAAAASARPAIDATKLSDEALATAVEDGDVRFFNIEKEINDLERGVKIRRMVIEKKVGRSIGDLPYQNYNCTNTEKKRDGPSAHVLVLHFHLLRNVWLIFFFFCFCFCLLFHFSGSQGARLPACAART